VLVRRAIGLLDPRPGERIADFFCGLGNFTLPIARRGAVVIGVEGHPALVRRAGEIAAANRLAARASFRTADLFAATPESLDALGPLDKALLDPPREGARGVGPALRALGVPRAVYVSCDPATLARDLRACAEAGYRVATVVPIDMFPQTHHVEGVALLEHARG
jgi:23S rRNA (uracil1939-C5)-methyltransferase